MSFTADDFRDLLKLMEEQEARLERIHGLMLEGKCWRQAASFFGPLARRIRVVESGPLADLLDDAADSGLLRNEDRDAVMLADLVISGRRRVDQADIYILVEVSAGIRPEDVIRAADRAAALEKLGRPVIPVVAGEQINAEAVALASDRHVWHVLDGHIFRDGQRGTTLDGMLARSARHQRVEIRDRSTWH